MTIFTCVFSGGTLSLSLCMSFDATHKTSLVAGFEQYGIKYNCDEQNGKSMISAAIEWNGKFFLRYSYAHRWASLT